MAETRTGLVVATTPGALERVAGLPLVVRAILALRAAGVDEVAVFAGPQVRRVRALVARRCPGVPCLAVPDDADRLEWGDWVVLVSGEALFEPTALAPVLDPNGPAWLRATVAATPDAVHVVRCPSERLLPLLRELATGAVIRADGLRRLGIPGEAVGPGDGLFLPLDRAHSAATLETLLLTRLASRTSATDGYLSALIDRRLSRPLTRLLLGAPVTPAQVTVVSVLIGLAGAAALATTSYGWRLGGTLALVASEVLDNVDGELARARFQQSVRGARLDLAGDYLVNLAVFAGLAVGLWREGLSTVVSGAAIALVGGVVAAMAVVHALFLRPALARGGDLHWAGDATGLRGTPLGTVVERLASRDYTYLLVVCALAGRLSWFVVAAAAGAWVFTLGLVAYVAGRRLGVARPGAPGAAVRSSAPDAAPGAETEADALDRPAQLALEFPPAGEER